jgi:hypothetical protein
MTLTTSLPPNGLLGEPTSDELIICAEDNRHYHLNK